MTFKLYELSDSINRVAEMIEEGAEGLEDTLEALDLTFQQKAENIAKLIRSKAAERDAIDAERERLAKRSQALDKQVEWLLSYVEREMVKTNTLEVKSSLFKIKLAMSPPRVEVLNQNIIPDLYIRTSVSRVPDKMAIKDALKGGSIIPGVELRQDLRLSVK